MKAVLMRVRRASVTIDERETRSIGRGFLILLAVTHDDTEAQAVKLADKLCSLRLFEDGDGKINLTLDEVGGEIMIVSQFTLYGNCRNGRRPEFLNAARPETAIPLYEKFVSLPHGWRSPLSLGVPQEDSVDMAILGKIGTDCKAVAVDIDGVHRNGSAPVAGAIRVIDTAGRYSLWLIGGDIPQRDHQLRLTLRISKGVGRFPVYQQVGHEPVIAVAPVQQRDAFVGPAAVIEVLPVIRIAPGKIVCVILREIFEVI